MKLKDIISESDVHMKRPSMVVIHVYDDYHAGPIGRAIKKFCSIASMGGDAAMYISMGDEKPFKVMGIGHDIRNVDVLVDGEKVKDDDIK